MNKFANTFITANLFALSASAQTPAQTSLPSHEFPGQWPGISTTVKNKQLYKASDPLSEKLNKMKAVEFLKKDYPVSVVSLNEAELASLRGTPILFNKSSSNQGFWLSPSLGTINALSAQQKLKEFLGEKRNELSVNGVVLEKAQDVGMKNLQRIARDANVQSLKIVSMNLKKLDLGKLFPQGQKLCEQNDIICGIASSSGWVQRDGLSRMSIDVIDKDRDAKIFLVQKGSGISGAIYTEDGIQSLRHLGDDTFALTKSNPSSTIDSDDVRSLMADKIASSSASVPQQLDLGLNAPVIREEDCPNPSKKAEIEVLVAYTSAAEEQAALKGHVLEEHILRAEWISNRSFVDNDIDSLLKIKKIMHTPYSEKGDFAADIDEVLKEGGQLQNVRDERRKTRSDVVVLVEHSDDPKDCGLAADIGATYANAYVVVNWQCLTDRYSFVHEIAHLAGAWHDPQSVSSIAKIQPSFAAGYITKGTKRYATIMAYTTSCDPGKCPRALYWSNPFRNTKDGQALGTNTNNFDACILRRRFPVMQKFGEKL